MFEVNSLAKKVTLLLITRFKKAGPMYKRLCSLIKLIEFGLIIPTHRLRARESELNKLTKFGMAKIKKKVETIIVFILIGRYIYKSEAKINGATKRVLWYEYIDNPNDRADITQTIFRFDLIKNKYIPNNRKN